MDERNARSTKLNVRLPNDLYDRLVLMAERERRPLSQLVTFALEAYLAVPGNVAKKKSR